MRSYIVSASEQQKEKANKEIMSCNPEQCVIVSV